MPSLASTPRNSFRANGFTVFELTMVVMVIAIVAAILVPSVGNNLRSSRLSTAANVLAADIEYCSSECITRPSTPRAIVFDTTLNKYTVQDLNTSTIVSHPADSLPFVNDFTTGRNIQLQGVAIRSIAMGAGTLSVLTFDAYGRPSITADVIISLSYNNATMTVTVKKGTGDVTITSP